MIFNNGLAERGNKVKLNSSLAQQILNQYESSEDVVFELTAEGLGIQYQWQLKKNANIWVDIPNATGPKLRMSTITSVDNGSVFRCKLSNSAGTTYSDEVILSVRIPHQAPVITQQPVSKSVAVITSADEMQLKVAKIILNP
jgi:hypothetical protein